MVQTDLNTEKKQPIFEVGCQTDEIKKEDPFIKTEDDPFMIKVDSRKVDPPIQKEKPATFEFVAKMESDAKRAATKTPEKVIPLKKKIPTKEIGIQTKKQRMADSFT